MAECKLPEDLMTCILMRLPVKSLCRFKCVCKPWLSLFSTSDFVANHRDVTASNPENHSLGIFSLSIHDRVFSFFNANSTSINAIKVRDTSRSPELVGSYNGLVGLFCPDYCEVFLWNPATFQWKVLYCADGMDIPLTYRHSVGMGFDSTTNDFKVLSILCRRYSTPDKEGLQQVKAIVYSANRDCWEKVELGFKLCLTSTKTDAILSGVPYWRGLIKDLGEKSGFSKVYVRYDVKNGVFDHIPVPKLDVNSNTTTRLVEWKNRPAVLMHSPEKENVVGVVIFDEREGEWSTKFSIGIPIATEIYYFKGSKILLETNDEKLFLFDFITNTMKEVCIKLVCPFIHGVEAFSYIVSLVHIKGMKTVKEINGLIQLDTL